MLISGGFLKTLIHSLAALPAVIGIIELLRWIAGVLFSVPFEPQILMAPSSALLFMVYGSAIFFRIRNPLSHVLQRIEVFMVSIAAFVALLIFFLSFLGIHLNAEHLGIPISGMAGKVPIGNMSPVTAFCFVLAAVSFLMILPSTLDQTRHAKIAFWLACAIIMISFFLLIAHFLGEPWILGKSIRPPASSTSIAFFALGLSLFILDRHAIQSKSIGGIKETGELIIPVFLMFAIGVISTGYFYFLNYQKHYRTEVEGTLSSIVDLKVSDLMQWRKERLGDASIFYKNANFSGLVQRFLKQPRNADARERLRRWLQLLQAAHNYDKVFLIDINGVERMSVPDFPKHFLHDNFSEVLSSKQVSFLDLHRDSGMTHIHMSIRVPIINEQDTSGVFAILIMHIDPEQYLYPVIESWPTSSRTAETLLIRRDRNDVLFLSELRFQKDSALKVRIPLSRKEVPAVKAVLGETGILEGMDYRGKRVLGCVRPIPGSPWFIVARIDMEEVNEPTRQKLFGLIVVVGSLLLGSGAYFGLARRKQFINIYKERYEQSEALRSSEERYHNILDNMLEGCQIIGFDWRYIYVNDEAAKQGGTVKEELIDNTIMEKYPGIDHTEMFGVLRDCLEKRTTRIIENEFIYPDSTKRWFKLSIEPVLEGIFILSLDITERKLIEEMNRNHTAELEQRVSERTVQLQNVVKELEAFSYSVSHDLRAPLRAINGFATILFEDYNEKLNDEGKRVLNVIRENVNKMSNLINDMLNLSRVSRQDIKFSMIDMTIVVQNVIEELKSGFPEQRVRFHINSLPMAYGDSKMIVQVFVNLLSNAFKFTSKKDNALIEVNGWSEDNGYVYSIKDNGVGFDMQYAHKLFNIFQRLHSSDEFEGTGIGLAIIKRIIDKHGGRVWAEGKVNEGATFYFTLPAKGEKSNEYANI